MGATGSGSRFGQSQQRRTYPAGLGSRRWGGVGGRGLQSRLQTDKTRRRAVINWPLLTGINPQSFIKERETIITATTCTDSLLLLHL